MSTWTVIPDPPHQGKSFMVCYEWGPPDPGGSIGATFEYLPTNSSVGVVFNCPMAAPWKDCQTITPPEGALGVTIHGGNAPDYSGTFLP